jgi:erythronate-4-phosphate dehydrogenase
VDLEVLVRESDILTLHVPLVEDGPYPTRNLLSAQQIGRLKPGAVVINACRGEAIDGEALRQARVSGALSWLVLDVWDPEPGIPEALLAVADIGTPHIAGHSVEGKVNGTAQIREELCRFFHLEGPAWDPEPWMPRPEHPVVTLPADGSLEERLRHAVRCCYDIRLDDRMLREGKEAMPARFTRLRRSYRDRREFAATRLEEVPAGEREFYSALGFCLSSEENASS